MKVPFAKYSGCGNDFIIIDNRSQIVEELPCRTIECLCHRQNGIGADGLILLENSQKSDFRMRIFNSDGSEAEMCGNGIRCLAHFIFELGLVDKEFSIETMHQQMLVCFDGCQVRVEMPPVTDHKYFIPLSVEGQELTLHFLDTGVPHVVLFVEDISDDAHLTLAPHIRFHPHFQPKGTNVNFAKIHSDNSVEVRTYERGVEAETLACGTGAVAIALAAAKVHNLPSPVTIRTRSADLISVSFDQGLSMAGPAVRTFEGFFLY